MGLTSVASQHRARPSGDATYTARSRRRRSDVGTPGAIVSPLTRQDQAHPRADVQPGSAVDDAAARRKRNNTYPELGHARRCRLVVVGTEVGGRFSTEVVQFLRLLARHRAAAVPRRLRPAAITAWVARWSGLLAVAAQRAFAASLLELPPAADLGDGSSRRRASTPLPPGRPVVCRFGCTGTSCTSRTQKGVWKKKVTGSRVPKACQSPAASDWRSSTSTISFGSLARSMAHLTMCTANPISLIRIQVHEGDCTRFVSLGC